MDTKDTEMVTLVNKNDEYKINQDNVYRVKTDNNKSLVNIENELNDDELLEKLNPTIEFNNNPVSQNKWDEEIEFFQCQRCSEYNVLKTKSQKRRRTIPRHIRVNAVTWASFKRYASLNNVSLDYALMLLLYNAQTKNINYLVNEKMLVSNPTISSRGKFRRITKK